MKPKIYYLAEMVAILIATASKVVNNTERISNETRNRIVEIMLEPELIERHSVRDLN